MAFAAIPGPVRTFNANRTKRIRGLGTAIGCSRGVVDPPWTPNVSHRSRNRRDPPIERPRSTRFT